MRKFTNVSFTGITESYFTNGQLWFEGHYKEGKWDSLRITYYDDGQLQSKGHYKDGKLDGLWEYFYQDGTVYKEWTGTYKDGEKVSE